MIEQGLQKNKKYINVTFLEHTHTHTHAHAHARRQEFVLTQKIHKTKAISLKKTCKCCELPVIGEPLDVIWNSRADRTRVIYTGRSIVLMVAVRQFRHRAVSRAAVSRPQHCAHCAVSLANSGSVRAVSRATVLRTQHCAHRAVSLASSGSEPSAAPQSLCRGHNTVDTVVLRFRAVSRATVSVSRTQRRLTPSRTSVYIHSTRTTTES
jgi:hypothetical protein